MSPEYLEELADAADPERLWTLSPYVQITLRPEDRRKLDTGVALRRHASDRRRLLDALARGKSVLITPASPNCYAIDTIDTPRQHAKYRKAAK